MAVFRTHKAGYRLLAIFWLTGLCLFAVYSVISQNTSVVQPSVQDMVSPANCITDVRLFHSDPNNENGSFTFSFDSLSTENGRLGIFGTALQRTLCIQGLRVGIYDQGLANSNETGLKESSLDLDGILGHAARQMAANLLDALQGQDAYAMDLGVDFRNISKLSVRDFQLDHYRDGIPALSIKSKIARTDPGQSGLVLRGHVVLSGSSHNMLQCNHVVWDITDKTFIAKGRYALTRNGINTTGSSICLDMNLNEINASQAKSTDGKENSPCYAQAQ